MLPAVTEKERENGVGVMMRMGVGERDNKKKGFSGSGVLSFWAVFPLAPLNSPITLQALRRGPQEDGWRRQGAPIYPEHREPVDWICPGPAPCSHSFWTLHFLIRNLSLGDVLKRKLLSGIPRHRLHGAHCQQQPHLSLLLPAAPNGSPGWTKLLAPYLRRALLCLSLFHSAPLIFPI